MLLFSLQGHWVLGFAQFSPTPSSERELLQESGIIVKVLSPSRLLLAAVMGVALVSAGVSPASAAPVVDQTQSGASIGVMRVSFLTVGAPPPEGLGSQFTAGVSGQLTQIDIPVTDALSASGTFLGVQVSVYSVDSFGVPTGGPLAVQDVPGAVIATLAAGGTLNVVFSTPATVAAGTPYAFVVEVLEDTDEQVEAAARSLVAVLEAQLELHAHARVRLRDLLQPRAPAPRLVDHDVAPRPAAHAAPPRLAPNPIGWPGGGARGDSVC
jgi:hypothetical protein